MSFESLWTAAVHHRLVSRDLRPRVERVYRDLCDGSGDLGSDLQELLEFLASDAGRTDANCCVVDRFFALTEEMWQQLDAPLCEILSDMATLHDAIYAPKIASTFGALPEQLLERVRELKSTQ